MAYATFAQLETFLGDRVPLPDEPEASRMLTRASETMDQSTSGRAALFWEDPLPNPVTEQQEALQNATCAQVEYWLEVGEEHDIVGPLGARTVGRFMVANEPARLAPRAREYLRMAGILGTRAGIK